MPLPAILHLTEELHMINLTELTQCLEIFLPLFSTFQHLLFVAEFGLLLFKLFALFISMPIVDKGVSSATGCSSGQCSTSYPSRTTCQEARSDIQRAKCCGTCCTSPPIQANA